MVIDTALLSLPESTSGVFAFGVGVLQHTREHYVYVVASSLDGKIAGLFPFRSTGSKLEPLTFVFARHLETQAQAAYITMDVKRQRLFAAYSCAGVAMFDISSPSTPRLSAWREFYGMVFQVVTLSHSPLVLVGLPAREDHESVNSTSGIAVLNASSPQSFEESPLQMLADSVAYSAIAIAVVENEAGHPKIVVANGGAGLYIYNTTGQ